MRRFRRRHRGSRSMRNREWIGFTTSLNNDYAKPDEILLESDDVLRSWILTPEEVASFWDEPTIVRLLLGFSCYQAGSPTRVTSDYRSTIRGGLITWKHAIQGTPVSTSLDGLDPSDSTADWLWWQEIHFQHTTVNQFGTSTVEGMVTAPHGRYEVKAKRKLELGYGLVLAFHCIPWSFPAAGASPAGGALLHVSGRILVLNH